MRRARRRRQRIALLAAVAVSATGVGVVAYATTVLRGAELATVDARFSIRGSQPAPPDVVVVGLDSRSLAAIAERPPIPRRFHARVIERLHAAGARVIAYDFEFSSPSDSTADDELLLDAIEEAQPVVLATSRISKGDAGLFVTPATVRSLGAIAASSNFPERSSRGGVIRRLPHNEAGVPHFAVAAARIALGHDVDASALAGDGAWIDFPGPDGTVTTIPFRDVLDGEFNAALVRGRVVVVGATSPILQDVHATSAAANVPGPEINAAAIQSLLDGLPLRGLANWASIVLLLAAGSLIPVSALWLRGLRWLPVPVLLAGGGAISAQLLFDHGTIVPVVAPAAALLAATLGTITVAYATDVRERRYLRSAFARFVPPGVVDEVIAQAGDELRLGGVRRDGTVVFCDLRGFTTVAERLTPEQVIELLNRYLELMSDAILDQGGTVVSYMGDGIMAVFGAPLPQDDHADRAVAAVEEMLGPRLAEFNAWLGETGIVADSMRMGAGVCSGPVMSGNVGSQRRLEYTAVGDTTNTASRLESMTKDTGVAVLVSDATRVALRRTPATVLRSVGALAVRGRAEPMLAWTLGNADGAGDEAGPANAADLDLAED